MSERFDESWEYHVPDPEVAELLADGQSGRVSRDQLFDVRQANAGISLRPPPRPLRPTVAVAIAGHLVRHGPDTTTGIATALGVPRNSVKSALRRHHGNPFHVAGRVPFGPRGGKPLVIWSLNRWMLRAPVACDDLARDFSAGAMFAGPVI